MQLQTTNQLNTIMVKQLHLKLLLLLFMVLGAGTAWATEVTFSWSGASNDTSYSGEEKDGVTLSVTSGSTSTRINSSSFRVYKGGSFTLSVGEGYKITSIKLNAT